MISGRITRAAIARGLIIFGLLTAFPFVVHAAWIVNIAFFTLMYAALATAWNLLGGYTGYITLGNVAFFGLGAYALGIMTQHTGVGYGWWPFLTVPLIGLLIGLISIPIALVAYRTRAISFIIVTITLVVILQYLAFNLSSITGGTPGLSIPIPKFSAGNFDRIFYLAMLVIYALSIAVCWYVRRSRLGLMMFAVRDDEDRASGVGVAVNVPKFLAFAVSAGLSAMVGSVWAYYLSNLYPQFAFDAEFLSMAIILVAFLGGVGTLWGPSIGALILIPAQQYLAFSLGASELYLIGYAAVFVVVMLLLPRGVVPSISDRLSRKRRSKPGELTGGTDVPGQEPRVRAANELAPS